jgi:hypothetical protein
LRSVDLALDLSIDNLGQIEIGLTPENLRILMAAVNQVLETADWEFHSLMGVWPDEAQPVADRLREIVDHISTDAATSDKESASQDTLQVGRYAGGIKLVQGTGATVRLALTEPALLVVRNALNTVVGA